MPTYEYACTKCGHEFDFFQSMNDKPLTVCAKEKCKMRKWGKGRVKKLMSQGAGLIFKGSGFYITDYRSEKYKEAAKKEAPAAPSGSTASESKGAGEAKPAPAKSESKPSSGESKPSSGSNSSKSK